MSKARNKRNHTVAAFILGAATAVAQQPFDLDASFRTHIEKIYVSDMALLDNGQLLVSGELSFQGVETYGARLHSDGSRDLEFPPFPWMGGKITLWQDKYYCGVSAIVMRSDLNGVLDPTFQHLNDNAPLFSSFQGGDYHVYTDGSVVLTGSHIVNVPDSGWVGMYNMIWFNNDGTLDMTRRPRWGNGAIYLIVPLPDGKFLLSGASTMWEGVPVPNTFRVQADGTLDTSFTCAMGWGEAASMTVLDDGRILLSGLFKSEFTSPDTLHFVRVLPNGELDPTFNNDIEVLRSPWLPPLWPGNPIHWGQFALASHKVLSDGRIVLYGSHYIIEGQDRLGLAMLNADGDLLEEPFDASACGRYYYEPHGVIYGDIQGLLEAPDGSIYIHGAYHGYDDGTTNDPTQRFVSRLYGLDVGVREHEALRMEVYPNPCLRQAGPASSHITVELEEMPIQGMLLLRDALGREVLQQRVAGYQNTVPLHGLGSGVYLVELREGGERRAAQRVVVQ